jgi:hypothetical protein
MRFSGDSVLGFFSREGMSSDVSDPRFTLEFCQDPTSIAASLHGMVAASFAIEQSGLPHLTRRDETRELWNGDESHQRLRDMIKLTESNTV